ncbi:MAG: RluA family pseudouridine synthase [Candidatus Saccharibacteria bacterium]|nr:RluA family pseudouridine synthase [Candidatus Saccharibacteria bacterium]
MIITGKKFSKPDMSRVINGDTVLAEEPEQVPKFRLDLLLVKKYKSYNRATLQKFVEAGYVKVDGKVVTKSNAKFEDSVKLELNVPTELKNSDLVPAKIYEDENVLVLDKPAGLLSMAKGEYCPEKTLEDYGLLVHRLDRDTSGVVILAKNPEVQSFLRRQFQDRTTHKTYYAVVEGHPKHDEANIDLPIARDLKHKTTFRVDANGRPSETYYKVVKSGEHTSLVELKPKTGRTHQLRVHMKYLGTPILGDQVYSEHADKYPRLFLHAKSLEITLPGGKRETFVAELPEEFNDVLR